MTRTFVLAVFSGTVIAIYAGCGSNITSPINTGGSGGGSTSSTGSPASSTGSPTSGGGGTQGVGGNASNGGGGDESQGGGGGGSSNEVTTLADLGQSEGIVGIAVTENAVYFGTGSAIYMTGKQGGAPAPVVIVSISSLAADATNLYWSVGGGAGGIYAMPIGGAQGSQKLLASAMGVRSFAVDATSVYWPAMGPMSSAIMKVPIGGGTPTTLVALTQENMPSVVAVDTMNVYWYDMLTNAVSSIPIDGNGPIGTLDQNQESPVVELAAGGGWVYWGTQIPNIGLAQVPANGGTVKVFNDMLNPERVIVDAFDVYWSDHEGGIKAMPLGGGAMRQVSARSNNSITTGGVSRMAVDDTDVYWGDGSEGIVQKAPKAP